MYFLLAPDYNRLVFDLICTVLHWSLWKCLVETPTELPSAFLWILLLPCLVKSGPKWRMYANFCLKLTWNCTHSTFWFCNMMDFSAEPYIQLSNIFINYTFLPIRILWDCRKCPFHTRMKLNVSFQWIVEDFKEAF